MQLRIRSITYLAEDISGYEFVDPNGHDLPRFSAGAHIGVLASELAPDLLSHPEFMKGLPGSRDWPANIVITLRRNGEHFGRFFHQLFTFMLAGTSMPTAWVQLAPQVREQQRPDIPATICLMEAGHIVFDPEEN